MSDLRFEADPIRPVSRGFRRDRSRGKLLGVCAGIADYLGVDVTVVRVLWALGTLAGFGSLVLVYIVIALLTD